MNRAGKIFYLSVYFYKKKIPLLPKILWILNRVIFACDIPYKISIGTNATFSHNALGVVINPNSRIGHNVTILHEVTLGGNMGKRKVIDGIETSAPVIGNNVLIGAGAKILGPVKIGNNVKIGSNAVVLSDIEDDKIAVGIPAKVVN